jgi:pSer/pThr/pTyr-binding forkhead associated (FHA) protein
VPSGPHAGNPPLILKKLVALIGTSEKCHLRLMSSTVSKHHAMLITTSVGVYIRDLASRTKVLVNGEVVHEAWLQESDQVRIGKFLFTFNLPLPRPQMPTPAPTATMVVSGKTAPGPIQSLVVLIGRQNGSDIKLRDDAVSSRHAVIFEAAGKRYIRDLNSRTGTFVNGNQVHLEELKFGDEIRVGDQKLSIKAVQTEVESLPEPVALESELLALESEPLPVESEPLPVESESLPVESEELPVESEPPPQRVESHPLPIKSRVSSAEAEPKPVKSEPPPLDLEPLPVESSEPSPTALEAISLAPPDEPIALAPEPPNAPAPSPPVAPATPIASPPPAPKPRITVTPRIELIPMQPPHGTVLQLRPPLSPAPPPKPAPAAPIVSSPLPAASQTPAPPAPPIESAASASTAAVTVPPAPIASSPLPAASQTPAPPAPPIESAASASTAAVTVPPAPIASSPLPAASQTPAPPAPPIESPASASTAAVTVPPAPIASSPQPAKSQAPAPPVELAASASTAAVTVPPATAIESTPPTPRPAAVPPPPPAAPPVEISAPAPRMASIAAAISAAATPTAPPRVESAKPVETPAPSAVVPPAQAPRVEPVISAPRAAPAVRIKEVAPVAPPAPPAPIKDVAAPPPPAAPAPLPAVAMDRPAAAAKAPIESAPSVPPPTLAIQLHPMRSSLSRPPEPAEEQPSWTNRANIKRIPPSMPPAQPEPQQPQEAAKPGQAAHAAKTSEFEDEVAAIDLSAGAWTEVSATMDEKSSHEASEPPLIATQLNLDADREPAGSEDLLFVEEDFAQELPLPPELAAQESEDSAPPIVGLHVRPEDFAGAAQKAAPNVASPRQAEEPISPPPAPPVEHSPIAGLRIGPEDFAEVGKPADWVAAAPPGTFAPPPLPQPPSAAAPPLPPSESKSGHASEVLDLDDQPMLDLDLGLPPLKSQEAPGPSATELEDAAFAAIVENFSGETAGPLIEESATESESTAESAPPPSVATADAGSAGPSSEPSEPVAAPIAPWPHAEQPAPPPVTHATAEAVAAVSPSEPIAPPMGAATMEPEVEEAPPTPAEAIGDIGAVSEAPSSEPSPVPTAVPHDQPPQPVAEMSMAPAEISAETVEIAPPIESPAEQSAQWQVEDLLATPDVAPPDSAVTAQAAEVAPLAAETAAQLELDVDQSPTTAQTPPPEIGVTANQAEIALASEPAAVEPEPTAPQAPAQPSVANADASEVAPPGTPASSSPAAPKAASPFSVATSISSVPNFSANLDHFLGGMPMKLPDLPKPPVASRRLEVSFGDKPPPSEPQPEPQPPALDAGPELIQTRPPPKAISPKAQPAKPGPFATASNISADQASVAGESAQPLPDEKKSTERMTSIFEGLAMTPLHEKDVFSDFEPTALNDAAFGGARLSRSDDYVLPESPEAASRLSSGSVEDFAASDFWNRTDEQEGVPPMGVPKPQDFKPPQDDSLERSASASSAEVTTIEIPMEGSMPAAGAPPRQPPVGFPMVGAGATGPQGVAAENYSRDVQPPASPVGGPPQRVPPVPRPRPRRRRLIPFLMLLMLLSMAAAYAGIWYLVPPRSHVFGSLTFLNHDFVAGTIDGSQFEATQRQLLGSDRTRKHAIELLQQHTPQVSAGFLQIPELYGRVTRSIGISATRENGEPQTQIKLAYDGADESGDRTRMLALLGALKDANAVTLDSGYRLRQEAEQAHKAVEDATAKIDQLQTQIAGLQRTVDQGPSADRLAQLNRRQSDLEQARFAAEDAVNIDRTNLSHLRAEVVTAQQASAKSSESAAAATGDPQLAEMGKQLVDLNARLEAAKRTQTAGVGQAREKLEDAVKQFNDELATAGGALDNSSVLKQFVDSAKDSQSKARELITMLVVDGEDLEKQLEDTRREVEDLIQSRQQEIWSADPQLQELVAKRDSAQHRYNANVGEGINDPVILAPLQQEIESLNAQIKTRQGQLGVDPSEVKLANGLNKVIDSLRNRLAKEKQQIDDVLNPLENQLKSLDPTVAALPDAQRALAQQIRDRLAALNDARRNYAQAVGQGAAAPSATETDLQKQVDELKARFDERQANLSEQVQKTVGDERARQLSDAQLKLEADKKALDDAKNAYDAARIEFDDLNARQRDAQAATASMQLDKDQLDQQKRTLEVLQRQSQQKQAEANVSFDIKPISDLDVVSTSSDPRRDYSTYAIVGLAVIFAFLVLTASGSSPAESPSTEPSPEKQAAEHDHHDLDDDTEVQTT